MSSQAPIRTEELAYWFLRLNGCPSIVDFVLHPDYARQSQRTDIDLLAVRLPYRCELRTSGRPMQDHPAFSPEGFLDVVIAEVTIGRCKINGPWTDPHKGNMQRVLNAIGVVPTSEIDVAAQSLYTHGSYTYQSNRVRLFAFGRNRYNMLPTGVVQLEWAEVLAWMWQRLVEYMDIKQDHPRWDRAGHLLLEAAREHSTDGQQFRDGILGVLKP